jgi:hypothetical protein
VNGKYRVNDEWKVYEIERNYQKKKGTSVEDSEQYHMNRNFGNCHSEDRTKVESGY